MRNVPHRLSSRMLGLQQAVLFGKVMETVWGAAFLKEIEFIALFHFQFAL